MVVAISSLLVQLWIPAILIFLFLHGHRIVNRRMVVKRTDPPDFGKRGDVRAEKDGIRARFLWSARFLSYERICTVGAFSDDDCSHEDWHEFIILRARSGAIIFDASDEAHRIFVSRLIKRLNGTQIDWRKDFQEGTIDKPVILYHQE